MTYVLIHGAGGSAWSWHLVLDELGRRGHEALAVDLPCDDDSAGLAEYVGHLPARRPAGAGAESSAHVRNQSGTPFEKPWPLEAWPDVPTRFLLCRDDRFFPAAFQRRVVRERLGITADEMGGGHLPMLARPVELVDHLESFGNQAPAAGV